MKIGVTSENKLKVDAVRGAYHSRGFPCEVVGYTANSGVGEQPINEQALGGARNRITDIQKRVNGLDLIVSIESGIFEEDGQWVDHAVVVIFNAKTGEEYVDYSDGVVFPREYVERTRDIGFDKMTVGKVMEKEGYVKDNKDPHKSITGKPRQEYIEETLGRLVRQVEIS